MGSGQSRLEFNPDPGQRTRPKSSLQQYNKLVVFGENTYNQVAFLLNPVSCRSGQESVLRIRVEYDVAQGNPVLGLATGDIDPQSVNIRENESLFVWDIRDVTVRYRGQLHQLEQPVPEVASGAEVTLQYKPTSRRVAITVANPGKDSLSEGFALTNLSSDQQLLPFVGDLYTGDSKTRFCLLESSVADHTNNSLIDMTGRILFTSSCGVVNISRDCKSVTRTSTQQGNGCALLPIKINSGVHQWALCVKCDFGASLCLGLARYPFMLSEDYLKDHVKHIYRHPGLLVYRSYRGLLYQDGKQLQNSLEPLGWQHGKQVLVEFRYDSNNGTLEISRNSRSLGIAFKGLSGIFQPVVCFYAAYEKEVQLKHYLTSEPSIEMTVQSTPPSDLKNTTPAKNVDSGSGSVGFEQSLVYGSVNISADKTVLSRDKTQSGNCLCLLNQSCYEVGTYRISFIIEYDHGASTCLGVTSARTLSEVKMSSAGNIYSCAALYIYRSFQGTLYLKGKEQSKRLGEYWMSGSLVEMVIEIANNGRCSVSFKVNAADMGVAFLDLERPLTPVVGFYAGMEKRVTVLHYGYIPEKQVSESVQKFALTLQAPVLKTDSGLNDVDTTQTHAAPSQLPLLCSYKDAAVYYECCLKCEEMNKNIIALPCKHSTMCSKDLNLGVNAPTRHCMVCDEKILQLWNILLPKPNS